MVMRMTNVERRECRMKEFKKKLGCLEAGRLGGTMRKEEDA